jgi:hypothetical protein
MDALVAYLDPGSGSMILQAILGGVAGLLVALKMFGRRMVSFLTFWKRDEAPTAAAESKTDT